MHSFIDRKRSRMCCRCVEMKLNTISHSKWCSAQYDAEKKNEQQNIFQMIWNNMTQIALYLFTFYTFARMSAVSIHCHRGLQFNCINQSENWLCRRRKKYLDEEKQQFYTQYIHPSRFVCLHRLLFQCVENCAECQTKEKWWFQMTK